MAIIITSGYSKKIGLPAYSSHQYSVSLTSEVADLSQVEKESAKLFQILQGTVDREIQKVGYTPVPLGAGSTPEPRSNGHAPDEPRGNGQTSSTDREFKCSDTLNDHQAMKEMYSILD